MPITPATTADIPALVTLVNNAYRGEEGRRGWTHESHLIAGSRTDAAGIEELLQNPGAVILKYTGDPAPNPATNPGTIPPAEPAPSPTDRPAANPAGEPAPIPSDGPAAVTPNPLLGCVYLQEQAPRLYLGLLSVQPTQQNAGIGKQLLAAADHYARQHHCTHIHITVITARHELLAWYERHGYRRTGETEPFHAGEKFGIQKQKLELAVLEKPVPA